MGASELRVFFHPTSIAVIGASESPGKYGHEILKNLALVGFENVLILDLDTIEISNLSRSVLFSEADIGQPKAQAAAVAMN